MTEVPNPGLRSQPAVRTFFRVGGIVCTLAAVGMFIAWFMHLSSSMDSMSKVAGRASSTNNPAEVGPIINDAMSTAASNSFGSTWTLFAAMFLLSAGMWMLRAGFLGPATRYVAGETMPVVKDSVGYLTDGEGFMGIGRIVDDVPGTGRPYSGAGQPYAQGTTRQYHGAYPSSAQGIFCQHCGTRNDTNARFCNACGQRLVR